MTSAHEKLDYLELPASDFPATQTFYTGVFGWQFEAYGPDYLAFDRQGLEGGFYRSELVMTQANCGALAIFYSGDLEATLGKIQTLSGKISRKIQHFPGGRRFHFLDPNGNELGVWSDTEPDGTLCSAS